MTFLLQRLNSVTCRMVHLPTFFQVELEECLPKGHFFFVRFLLSSGNHGPPHFCCLSLSPVLVFSPWLSSCLHLFTHFYHSCHVALSAASFLLVFHFFLLNLCHLCVHFLFFFFLLLTYIRCPIFNFSIPSPSLNSFLLPVIACAIFVEFAPTLLIPRLGLSINFQVSPWWPFTRTPCHGWRSYRRHVFLLQQIFQKKREEK